MKRREFITLLGTAAVWPLAVRASSAMPVIGFLHSGSRDENAKRLAAFLKGLGDAGFIDGRNVIIEYRWALGKSEDLPAMAADLVGRKVALIATPGSTAAAVAAKATTTTIPIVFATGADPVALGFVESMNRPGRNATGIVSLNAELAAKRLGLLRDLVPQVTRYFAMANPTSPLAEPFIRDLEAGAARLGIHVEVLRMSNDAEIEAAFANLPSGQGNVLMSGPDAFFYTRRAQIVAQAARHAMPSIFDDRAYVEAGGLASYGSDFLNLMELAGNYTARVLRRAVRGMIHYVTAHARRIQGYWVLSGCRDSESAGHATS